MDLSMAYVNGAGESVEFRADGHWHYSGGGMRSWSASFDEVGGRVASFTSEPREFEIDAVMDGGDAAERDRAFEVFERDRDAGVPGTLRCNGWELRCWIVGGEPDSWWYDESQMRAVLKVRADDPAWRREETLQFFKDGAGGGGEWLDYPHGYPYDYKMDDRAAQAVSPFKVACPFRWTVYGPAEDPYVIVAGNRYQVNVSVEDGGLLVVDSVEGTVTLKTAAGDESSAFADAVRERGANVFAKLPAGTAPLSWSGAFGFDLTYVRERLDPGWS